MIISVTPYLTTLDAIEKRLTEMGKGDRTNEVIKKAINEVAGIGKKEIWKGVKHKYTLKEFAAKDVKRRSYSAKRQGAILTVTGPILGVLEHYETAPNTDEDAAMVKIYRESALKALEIHNGQSVYKAFVARMSSGHVGIFQRVPGKYMKKHMPGRNTKGREAIKEILSLSKAKAAEMVYERDGLEAKLQEELVIRMHKHMNAVIGG